MIGAAIAHWDRAYGSGYRILYGGQANGCSPAVSMAGVISLLVCFLSLVVVRAHAVEMAELDHGGDWQLREAQKPETFPQ